MALSRSTAADGPPATSGSASPIAGAVNGAIQGGEKLGNYVVSELRQSPWKRAAALAVCVTLGAGLGAAIGLAGGVPGVFIGIVAGADGGALFAMYLDKRLELTPPPEGTDTGRR
jgi:hypothetical protein